MHIAELIIIVCLQIGTTLNICLVRFKDPGIIPKGDTVQPEESNELQDKVSLNPRIYTYRYCYTCKIMRAPKASHCCKSFLYKASTVITALNILIIIVFGCPLVLEKEIDIILFCFLFLPQ